MLLLCMVYECASKTMFKKAPEIRKCQALRLYCGTIENRVRESRIAGVSMIKTVLFYAFPPSTMKEENID